jgi:hypothetical protein
MSVLKVNQIQTANGVIMANLNSSGANIGFQLASTLAPTFSAYVGTAQSISAGVTTKVQLTQKDWDTGTCFNNTGSTVTLNGISTPAYCFAPNVAGYYMFTGQTENVTGGGARIALQISKNATVSRQGTDLGLPSGSWSSAGGITVTAMIYMNGTSDYVDMRLYDSGGYTIAVGPTSSYFQGFLARSA